MQVRYSWDSDLIDDEVLRGSDKGRLRIDGAEGEICTLWWDDWKRWDTLHRRHDFYLEQAQYFLTDLANWKKGLT